MFVPNKIFLHKVFWKNKGGYGTKICAALMYWSHLSYELYLKKQYEMQEVRASIYKVQIEEDKEIGIKFLAKEHIKPFPTVVGSRP